MERLKSSALLYFVLALGGVELGLRYVLPYREIVSASSSLRNPLLYRAWPEYISRDISDKSIVLLGNSQAVGNEFPDVNDTYVGSLSHSIKSKIPSYSLHNWSVSGLQQSQLELLTFKAIERKHDLLIFVVSLNNFSGVLKNSVNRDPTDISVILGDLSLYPQVMQSNSIKKSKLDSLIGTGLQLHSAIIRSRGYFLDYLSDKVKFRSHKLVFGHYRKRNVMQLIADREPIGVIPQLTPTQVRMTKDNWIRQFRKKQLVQAREFYNHTKGMLTNAQSTMIWLWMPFALREDTAHISQAMQTVHREFCDQLMLDAVVCVDLSDEIDPSQFISPDFSSHLSKQGHQSMAKLVTPIILDAIH